METATETTNPMVDLRRAAGHSQRSAAQALAAELGEESRSHVSILKIEREGTSKHTVIKALAKVYGVSVDEIESALNSLPMAV